MVLPEQIIFSLAMEFPDIFVPHSLKEDSEPTQDDDINQTGSSVETEVLSVETAEPQSSCRHTTADDFRVQSDQPPTGLHSPWCFISSVPIHVLVPSTNLTSPDSVQRQESKQQRLTFYSF